MSKEIIVRLTGDDIKIKGGEYVRDIVYCPDCRDCSEKGTYDCPSGYGYLYCTRKKSVVDEDDYCSWGERR